VSASSSVYQLYGSLVRSNVNFGPAVDVDELASVDLDLWLEPQEPSEVDERLPPGVPVVGGEDEDFNFVICKDDQGYLMRVKGLVDVRFSPGLESAVCHPRPGIGEAHLRDLNAAVLSSWIVLRGGAVFHGSAVAEVPCMPGVEALAFIGAAFGGKSTWAALMCSMGARFLTDDALPIGNRDGRPVVQGGCPELRLRHFGADDWPAFAALPKRETVDGRLAIMAGAPLTSPVNLSCVIVLEQQQEGQEVTLERVPPRDAVLKLAASHRVGRMRQPEAHVVHFERATEVANSVPVYSARVPGGPPSEAWAQALVAELGAHFA
jgi:hypothetical protein